jgi:hypothetical protein
VDRLLVPARQPAADGLVHDGLAAHLSQHHLGRHLALAEAGHAQLPPQLRGGAPQLALERLGGHLHLHAHARVVELGRLGRNGGGHRSLTIPCASVKPGERLAAWLVTGPLGHLWSAAVDIVKAWARYGWARLRGRDPYG